jgi:hypothetical protein
LRSNIPRSALCATLDTYNFLFCCFLTIPKNRDKNSIYTNLSKKTAGPQNDTRGKRWILLLKWSFKKIPSNVLTDLKKPVI